MSDRLTLALILVYLLMAFVAAWEGLWGRAIYWVGASVISVGVLMQR